MGEIIFEGEAPYELLEATAAEPTPTANGVELVLHVLLEAPVGATLPARILLRPDLAAELGERLKVAADVARRWMNQC